MRGSQPEEPADKASEITLRLNGPLEASDSRVLAVLRSNFLVPPSSLPYNLTMHKHPGTYYMSRAFGWEFYHHYIRHFFQGQRGGFFVEAGALDGEYLSNTLWLETELGWSGLLLEADPINYRHLAWKQRRTWLSNTCLSKERHPRETLFESLTITRAQQYMARLFHASTRDVDSHPTLLQDPLSKASTRAYFGAQCFPLASYLLALNVTVIDFLSLDIQGHEWAVLRGLPLDAWRVRSLAVEHLKPPDSPHGGSSTDAAFVRYMETSGYHLVDVYREVDYFFVLRSDEALRRLSQPRQLIKFYTTADKLDVLL